MKTAKRYDVRLDCFPCSSKVIGFKRKLFPRAQALAICKRLKKSGINAFVTPYSVNV